MGLSEKDRGYILHFSIVLNHLHGLEGALLEEHCIFRLNVRENAIK